MPEVRKPKSGWWTPSMSCTARLVAPIFLPITRSPSRETQLEELQATPDRRRRCRGRARVPTAAAPCNARAAPRRARRRASHEDPPARRGQLRRKSTTYLLKTSGYSSIAQCPQCASRTMRLSPHGGEDLVCAAHRAEMILHAPEPEHRATDVDQPRREVRYQHPREDRFRLRLQHVPALLEQRVVDHPGIEGEHLEQLAQPRPVEAGADELRHHGADSRHREVRFA